jgi:hypothetical protein
MNKTIYKYTAVTVGALLFAVSAVFKGMDSATQAQLAKGGFSIYALIPLQAIILFLYLLPQTFRLGFFLICCYMGGAIAYSFGSSAGFAILTTVALWVGAYVREPELFWIKSKQKKSIRKFALSN